MEAAPHPWPALGVLLLRDGLVAKEILEDVLETQADSRQQRVSGWRLGEILIARGLITAADVARLVAEQYELPYLELDPSEIDAAVARLLPEDLVERFSALPIMRQSDGSLLLAVSDPGTVLFSDELRRVLGVPLRFAVVAPAPMREAIAQARAKRVAEPYVVPGELRTEASDEPVVQSTSPGGAQPAEADSGAAAAVVRAPSKYPPIGAILLGEGLVTEAELESALAQQRVSTDRRLGEILVERGIVTPVDVARAVADQYELPFVDFAEPDVDWTIANLLPRDIAERYGALPLRFLPDGALLVAIKDPTTVLNPEEILTALGSRLSFAVVDPGELSRTLSRERVLAPPTFLREPEPPAEPAHVAEEHATTGTPDEPEAAAAAAFEDEPEHEPEPEQEHEQEQEQEQEQEAAYEPAEEQAQLHEPAAEPEVQDEPAEPESLPQPADEEPPFEPAESSGAHVYDLPVAQDAADVAAASFTGDEVEEIPVELVYEPIPYDPSFAPPEPVEPEAAVVEEPEATEDLAPEPDPSPGTDPPDTTHAETTVTPTRPDALAVARDLVERAAELGADTVHLSAREDGVLVRARVDGVLREVDLAEAERATLEDELDTLVRAGEAEGLVATTLPTQHGTTAVLRVPRLEAAGLPTLDELAPSSPFTDGLRATLRRSAGLVVVAGPERSGRTTLLHAALREVAGPERAVVSIEASVERTLSGVEHVVVDPALGPSRAAGLRRVLDADPDVVAVDELADAETLGLALAAATSRLIVATTLARNAADAVSRLVGTGAAPELLASSLSTVVGARVVRRICSACREAYFPAAEELERLSSDTSEVGRRLLARGRGCPACAGTGYDGRAGAYELLDVSDEIRALVVRRAPAAEIQSVAAASGMRTVREEAVRLCLEGLTTVAEVDLV